MATDDESENPTKFDIEQKVESDDNSSDSKDGLTSSLRCPLPKFIDEIENQTKTWDMVIKPTVEEKNPSRQIWIDSIADKVLAFFNACGINVANLSDEQVTNYIKYIAENTSNNIKPRTGSVESTHSSSSDYSR